MDDTGEPLVVRLRHYGPVVQQGATPISIRRREAGSSASFLAVPINDFTLDVDPDDPNTLLVGPGEGGFEAGWEYELTGSTQLVCSVPGQPAVDWKEPYRFTLLGAKTDPCPSDVDGSGTVGFEDLLAVLNDWGICVDCPTDIDASGDVNFLDLLEVLTSWGPCV